MDRPDLAVLTFDLAPSGVVRNALRIAQAASAAGLRSEIWSVQAGGEMQADVPPQVRQRIFGASIGGDYSRLERLAAARNAAPSLAAMMTAQRPRILLSAGNHVHVLAASARRLAGRTLDSRMIGRVSNALPRFGWAPWLLAPSIFKRVRARQRLDSFDRLVTVSEFLREDVIRQLLIDGRKVVAIPNGIDTGEMLRLAAEPLGHPWLQPGQPPLIVGVGRLVAQKNFKALIRAFAAARKSMKMRLILLGDGSEREKLQALTRELQIEQDVEFAGHVPNPAPFLAGASLFVLPSRWEGMSNALLEAMAVGCPVVATRCDGSVELLGPEFAAQVVPVGDVEALSATMVRTLRNPPKPERLRARAAQFDLNRTTASYVRLLREELERG